MRSTDRAVLGALAGLSATMIMTIVMRRGHQSLPPDDAYPLPPRELTERIIGPSGGIATVIAHFAYGGAAGALFAVLPRPIPAIVYGPLVWMASYLGWVPLAGRLRPATRHPASRNVLMILAHLVWGTCLGAFLKSLTAASRGAFGPGASEDAPRAGHGR